MFKVREAEWRGFIVPFPELEHTGCAMLLGSRKTWLTAKAGDAVLLRQYLDKGLVKYGSWERYFIESIQVYRAYPIDQNARFITSGRAWLDGE